jgi:hypothetical protein
VSYDLHVISKRQAKASHLETFLATFDQAAGRAGRLEPNGHLLLGDGAGTHAEVDGPSRIEAEDVPEAAAGAIGRSGWLVAISVKPPTAAAWPADLAIHLAQAADGVVYDPQQDAVTWPKGWQPRDAESGKEIIDEVELSWSTTLASSDPQVPSRFLRLLHEHCATALPRRYGGFEPLPHRFDGERADEAFVKHWLEESNTPVPMLFWTATRPCFDGRVIMSSAAAGAHRVENPCVNIGLNFDARPCYRDAAFTEAIVKLFVEVASELECVYAGAWVLRGVTLPRGGNPAYRAGPEVGPMPRRAEWVGLPAGPTWLAWFGGPYAALLRRTVAAHVAADLDRGLFLRLGPEPMNFDELADRFPALPAQLLARRRDRPGRWLAGAPYTGGNLPPSEAAEQIPELT